MSISLNNHESRIKDLEDKRPEWIPLRHGAVAIPDSNWVKICDFDQHVYQFGMIGVDNSYNTIMGSDSNIHLQFLPLNGHQLEFVAWDLDPLVSKNEKIMVMVRSGSVYCRTISDTNEHDNYVVLCWGLKLYYNFSYNIYYLIYTFLEFLFKEV